MQPHDLEVESLQILGKRSIRGRKKQIEEDQLSQKKMVAINSQPHYSSHKPEGSGIG